MFTPSGKDSVQGHFYCGLNCVFNHEVQNAGARLVGDYHETIWGVQPQPVTVVGSFSLQRPEFPKFEPPLPQPWIYYLPLIFKNSQ